MDAAAAITALADPTRRRIAELIASAPDRREAVTPLADVLGLRQPTVSHHLRVLREAGVVAAEKDGRRTWHRVTPAALEHVIALTGVTEGSTVDRDRALDDLAARFRGIHSRETVARCLDESIALLRAQGAARLLASRVTSFTASRLEARRPAPTARPEILFVCVRNAGRSQLAAALTRHLAGDRVSVRSAGSAPGGDVAAVIVHALDEVGVPLGGEFPKPLTDDVVRAANVVVTMGCGDACPVYPGIRYEDWDLPDPLPLAPGEIRAVCDDIDRRVRALLATLL